MIGSAIELIPPAGQVAGGKRIRVGAYSRPERLRLATISLIEIQVDDFETKLSTTAFSGDRQGHVGRLEELKLQSGLRRQYSSAELTADPNGLSRRIS